MGEGTITAIIIALLAVSEALSFIPKLRSNGVFQIIFRIIEALGRGFAKEEDKKDEL